MAGGPRLGLSGQQRLQINPGLNQSVALLRLDSAGLTAYLEGEAANNPWLHLDPPVPPTPRDWLPRWQASLPPGAGSETASAGPSLIAHVMAEVRTLGLTPAEQAIALHLIEALEPTGWMTEPLDRIAVASEAPVAEVEATLHRLQGIEPRGLFARDLAECLALQAHEAGQLDAVMTGVLANLDLLAKGQAPALARKLGISDDAIQQCLSRLRAYHPKPGTVFDPLTPAHCREPDLILTPLPGGKGGWQLALNRSAQPDLRLATPRPTGNAPQDAKARARALVTMLVARNQTLLRVAEAIIAHQGAAVLGGAGALIPLTMAEIGQELSLHESTISRAVAGTSMDTPRGVIWLRNLFTPEVARSPDGRAISKAALRASLVRLIAEEPRDAPLRDDDLAQALARDSGILLSRRTIAAYREEAGIPIAGRRSKAKMRALATGLAGKRPEKSQAGLSCKGI
jgi:RNA polymerase sigma-54 factor